MQQILSQLLTYAKEIWQYRWHAVVFSWILCLVGWTAIYLLPNSYQASARVFVDTQTILRPLLLGLTVQLNVDQQVTMMTRTLISRPNLEKAIRAAGLDEKIKTAEQKEALVDRLARQIEVKSSGRDNLYSITYADSSPDSAKKVVQALLSILVENSQGEKRKDTDQARRFIDEQIKIYEERLIEAENVLKEFKQKNLGFVPGEGAGQDYYSRVAESSAALAQAKLALQEAENGRDALQKQISSGEQDTTVNGEVTANPELEARILALRKNLDNMMPNFTEQHPDVVGTKRVLAQLAEQRKREIEIKKKGGEKLYQAPPDRGLRLAQAQAGANVASLKARVAEFEKRYAILRAAADKAPQIEAEFAQLNRDYNTNKQNYQTLLTRRDSVQMSGDLDTSTGAFDFRVIDPPRAPLVPTSPNRFNLMSFTLLGGIAGGIALAFLLSQIKPTFSDRRALRESTGLPVLGAVSMIWTDQERNKRKKNLAALAASYATLVIAYGGIVSALVPLVRPT